MRSAFCTCLLISLGIAAPADRAAAETPVFAYTISGSCLASPEGFNSKLQPVNPGVAWRITFNAVGGADANGNVTEVGQSVDSASFGAGPRVHVPAANAYKDVFIFTVTKPNGDGGSILHMGTVSGTFTAGPNAGLRFTISDLELKGWIGNGVSIYASSESPVVQTVSLSNGTRFHRICTVFMVSTSSAQ